MGANSDYIKVPAIYRKLKRAEEENVPIYISAPVGFGKTAAVQYFYRKTAVLWLDGEDGKISSQTPADRIRQRTIIIDNVSWVKDEASRAYIISLIEAQEKHIILVARAKIPEWLKGVCISHRFVLANEFDLALAEEQTRKMLENFDVSLPPEQISQIYKCSCGHPIFTIMVAMEMQNCDTYDESVQQSARINTFQYYNEALYAKWPSEMSELLQAASNFDTFCIDMLEIVMGSNHVATIMAEAIEIGDFLIRHENGDYEMRPMLQRYMQWRQILEEDKDKVRQIFERAAIYYEMQGQLDKALFYFDKAECKSEISRVLIKNAKKHPGTGHYYETRRYYFELSKEEIEKSPVLMAGMAMLYSLLLQPPQSEVWYNRLVEYEKEQEKGSDERKEAKRRIAYLDIALPHRATIRMIDILKNAALLIMDKRMKLPEFSVTSNLPSIMNGGKDFCEWSKSDRELARSIGKPVELVLGKWGAGLINIALAESLFEKGETDYYEIMTLLNSGYTKADTGGKIEMCFVSTAIMCKLHVSRNQFSLAKHQLEEFEKKAIAENAERLLPNLRGLQTQFHLYEGNYNEVENWVKNEAPRENMDFYILDRYLYVVKVRAYLMLGEYELAISLIERLKIYFEEYTRHYHYMENEILKAIVQYRMNVDAWKDTLTAVLPKLERYHFVNVIAQEGAAVRPLLQALKKLPVSEVFENEIREAVNDMARMYPGYLQGRTKTTIDLSEVEKKILNCYCSGLAPAQICELQGISNNTLKTHTKNIYKKLEVHNRTDAVRIAKELRL